MRKIACVLSALLFAHFLEAHHGPGVRGYDTEKSVEISGVVLKCTKCSGGSHGVLEVKVDSMVWSVTLPANTVLKKAKVSLGKLKSKAAVRVTGFPHKSKPNDMYGRDVFANGVKLYAEIIG